MSTVTGSRWLERCRGTKPGTTWQQTEECQFSWCGRQHMYIGRSVLIGDASIL